MGLRDVLAPKAEKGGEKPPEGNPDDTEVLDDEPKNMLFALIQQLRPGMDLSRVALPTFVLEPRSMLERIGDFLGHADLVFKTGEEDDPSERFIQVLRYYLSGWHIKVPGVKKPYNPILGEYFRCRYDYDNGTSGYYLAEQVSHHPPISAFYYASPENNLEVYGEIRPKSKFLGNSAATLMGGTSKVRLLDRLDDGEYVISMPNMYARGILFGKMVFELGDDSKVKNDANDIHCDVEFKTKGFFSGSYNSITGKLRLPSGDSGELSGSWSSVMELRRTKHGEKEVLFDASGAKPHAKVCAPEDAQDANESRRLWHKVTDAIKKKDLDAATDAKIEIEDAQREERSRGNQDEWRPRFFQLKGEDWHPLFSLPKDLSDKAAATQAVREWVFPKGSTEPPKSQSSH